MMMIVQEATPQENLLRAKKHRHNYSISTEAFSLQGREFVLHNISLKREYSEAYDFINYRRGLTYLEEIIDFKHTEPVVARKGLRKFKDLLPEYLDLKESHISNSKFHAGERSRLFKGLQDPAYSSFIIYNTEKLNGENAQFSFIDKFWVIGSKNKSLMVAELSDLDKLKNKHQHKLTILVAQAWFALLATKSEQEVAAIKLELSRSTLIGEYCNSNNMQHLIDYGKQPQLFFYALVEKENKIDECLPTSATYKFLHTYGLPAAKCTTIPTQKYQETIEKLRQTVVAMNEQTMKDGGEGGVVYVSGVDVNGEHTLLVCKVKTIEYRIYRKLREKLKIYIQKLNKGYDNLLKKFNKEIAEIAREFNLIRPIEHYTELARRAFELCQDQSRPISRFVSNRFIDFLRLLDRNVTREKFMEIVNSTAAELDLGEEEVEEKVEQKGEESESMIKEEQGPKRVIVLIPVTIPSTGKSSLLEIIEKRQPGFRLWSVSNDEIKRKVMDELRKKKKTLSREEAFEKSRQPTNKEFFRQLGETLKNISLSPEADHIFYLDKNHPENVLKKTNDALQEAASRFPNIQVLRLGLFPASSNRFQEKGIFRYPFSAAYMLTCLKRVSNRAEHLTLEGTDQDRCRIVLGFCNLFRNFSLSPFNIRKYFDGKVEFPFNNQQCLDQEKDAQMIAIFKEVLLAGKPGSFDLAHPKLELLVDTIKLWNLQELPREECADTALVTLQGIFSNFENYGKTQEKQVQKQQ